MKLLMCCIALVALSLPASAQKHSAFLRKGVVAINNNDGSISFGLEKTIDKGVLHKLRVGYEYLEIDNQNTNHTLSVGALHYFGNQRTERLNLNVGLSAFAGATEYEYTLVKLEKRTDFSYGFDGSFGVEYPVKNISVFADVKGKYLIDDNRFVSNVGIGVKYHF